MSLVWLELLELLKGRSGVALTQLSSSNSCCCLEIAAVQAASRHALAQAPLVGVGPTTALAGRLRESL